jgi:hypothetical protein
MNKKDARNWDYEDPDHDDPEWGDIGIVTGDDDDVLDDEDEFDFDD